MGRGDWLDAGDTEEGGGHAPGACCAAAGVLMFVAGVDAGLVAAE